MNIKKMFRMTAATIGLGVGAALIGGSDHDNEKGLDLAQLGTGIALMGAGAAFVRKSDFEPSKNDPSMKTYTEAEDSVRYLEYRKAAEARGEKNLFNENAFKTPKKNTFRGKGPGSNS